MFLAYFFECLNRRIQMTFLMCRRELRALFVDSRLEQRFSSCTFVSFVVVALPTHVHKFPLR